MSEVSKPRGVHLQANFGPGLGGLALLALLMHLVVGTPFFAVFLCGMFARWALRGAWWAWIPAGLFGIDALEHSGVHLGGIGLPLLFIIAGVLVVAQDHIWPPARKIGLIVIGCLILAGLLNNDHDRNVNINVGLNRPGVSSTATRSAAIPALNGRKLVINARDGDVNIEGRETTEVRTDTPLAITDTADAVILTGRDGLTLTVPTQTAIIVNERDADVHIKDVGGDITVVGRDGHVRIEVSGDPSVDLVAGSSGKFDLIGFEQDEGTGVFHHTGAEPRSVKVTGRSLDVLLARKDRVLR